MKNLENATVKFHSNFFNFIDVSTYYGMFGIDSMFSYTSEYIPEFFEPKETDWDKYGKLIGESYMEILSSEFLSELTFYVDYDLDTISFYMPKAYNYEDDSFHVDIEINKKKLLESFDYLITNEKEICEGFLLDNWKSRSGFWSFMPESIDQLKECDDLDIIFAFVVNVLYILEYDGEADNWEMTVVEDIAGNNSLYDFVTYQLTNTDNLSKIITDNGVEDVITEAKNRGYLTDKEIANVQNCGYGADIIKVLGIDNDYYEEYEFPINTKEEAVYVILKLRKLDDAMSEIFN